VSRVVKVERDTGSPAIFFKNGVLTIVYPELKALTIDVFLQYAQSDRLKSLGGLKRKLWDAGYVFTGPDFKLLIDRFVRGRSPYVIACNNSLLMYVRTVRVCSYFGDFSSDLPYISMIGGTTYPHCLNIKFRSVKYLDTVVFAKPGFFLAFSGTPGVKYEDLKLAGDKAGVTLCPSSAQVFLRRCGSYLGMDCGYSGKIVTFFDVVGAMSDGPMSAAKIAEKLNTTRVYVNAILYGVPRSFVKISEKPRLWKFVGS